MEFNVILNRTNVSISRSIGDTTRTNGPSESRRKLMWLAHGVWLESRRTCVRKIPIDYRLTNHFSFVIVPTRGVGKIWRSARINLRGRDRDRRLPYTTSTCASSRPELDKHMSRIQISSKGYSIFSIYSISRSRLSSVPSNLKIPSVLASNSGSHWAFRRLSNEPLWRTRSKQWTVLSCEIRKRTIRQADSQRRYREGRTRARASGQRRIAMQDCIIRIRTR